jgi:hypothetical protein
MKQVILESIPRSILFEDNVNEDSIFDPVVLKDKIKHAQWPTSSHFKNRPSTKMPNSILSKLIKPNPKPKESQMRAQWPGPEHFKHSS